MGDGVGIGLGVGVGDVVTLVAGGLVGARLGGAVVCAPEGEQAATPRALTQTTATMLLRLMAPPCTQPQRCGCLVVSQPIETPPRAFRKLWITLNFRQRPFRGATPPSSPQETCSPRYEAHFWTTAGWPWSPHSVETAQIRSTLRRSTAASCTHGPPTTSPSQARNAQRDTTTAAAGTATVEHACRTGTSIDP